MPEMMNMNPKIPTVKELWKDEKTKYRHWVIILAIGLIVIVSLTFASFILNLVDRDSIIDALKNNYGKRLKGTDAEMLYRAKNQFTTQYIIYASLILISLVAGIVWYFVSLVEVYKHKNFARLSQWPTLIVGVGAIISFVQLMGYLFSGNDRATILSSDATILSFSSQIIYIVIYFAASAPISRVRKIFTISDRIERMQKDPQFQAMQRQMNDVLRGGTMPNGPIGPVVASESPPAQNQPHQTGTSKPEPEVVSEAVDPELERLKRLSTDKLRAVAAKLSISGSEKMKKDELIEAIVRVTRK